jgi:hypothetical protein
MRRPNKTGVSDICDDAATAPGRPPPPSETRRGVSITVVNGTIRLRRDTDGREVTIRPPGGAVDAELENTGVFYAYNTHDRMRGRIVFIPFDRLIS